MPQPKIKGFHVIYGSYEARLYYDEIRDKFPIFKRLFPRYSAIERIKSFKLDMVDSHDNDLHIEMYETD